LSQSGVGKHGENIRHKIEENKNKGHRISAPKLEPSFEPETTYSNGGHVSNLDLLKIEEQF